MRILMIASEAQPWAKTGGLADVIGALPKALGRLGHAVDVVMPRYRGIAAGSFDRRLTVALGAEASGADVYVEADGLVRTVFIAQPKYFDRDALYGIGNDDYADNAERFAFLARAALGWARASGARPDVIHAHDWQAGLVPLYAGRSYPTVFTIHNLAYQGLFDASWLQRLGLGWELMHIDALEYWGRISYLKGGIVFSRIVTTVSPRYAQEIQTPQLGFGFDGILRRRAADLVGILNGIDYDEWDPAHDRHLPAPFDVSHLDRKRASKQALLERFGIDPSDQAMRRPVVGLISRLVDQKGFDLLAELLHELPRLGATFVLLGTGERRYEDMWLALMARHPGRIAAKIGFDEPTAHLIEGGADLFLMPSRFEPCGLNQMYSLRYGTIPVVHATGGLFDTVPNFDPATGEGTGFTFDEYSAQALLDTLRRALAVYQDGEVWRRLQRAGMVQDFSWDSSARQYVKVYERAAAGWAPPGRGHGIG